MYHDGICAIRRVPPFREICWKRGMEADKSGWHLPSPCAGSRFFADWRPGQGRKNARNPHAQHCPPAFPAHVLSCPCPPARGKRHLFPIERRVLKLITKHDTILFCHLQGFFPGKMGGYQRVKSILATSARVTGELGRSFPLEPPTTSMPTSVATCSLAQLGTAAASEKADRAAWG